MRNSLPQDFYHNLFSRIAIAEGTDVAIKAYISAIKNLLNMVAVAINVHKLLKLKKLGFLALPNLVLRKNRC